MGSAWCETFWFVSRRAARLVTDALRKKERRRCTASNLKGSTGLEKGVCLQQHGRNTRILQLYVSHVCSPTVLHNKYGANNQETRKPNYLACVGSRQSATPLHVSELNPRVWLLILALLAVATHSYCCMVCSSTTKKHPSLLCLSFCLSVACTFVPTVLSRSPGNVCLELVNGIPEHEVLYTSHPQVLSEG